MTARGGRKVTSVSLRPRSRLRHTITHHIIMIVISHGRARDGDALLNGKVDPLVRYDDVASLGEGRDDGGDGRKALRVDNGRLRAEETGNVGLEGHVNI